MQEIAILQHRLKDETNDKNDNNTLNSREYFLTAKLENNNNKIIINEGFNLVNVLEFSDDFIFREIFKCYLNLDKTLYVLEIDASKPVEASVTLETSQQNPDSSNQTIGDRMKYYLDAILKSSKTHLHKQPVNIEIIGINANNIHVYGETYNPYRDYRRKIDVFLQENLKYYYSGLCQITFVDFDYSEERNEDDFRQRIKNKLNGIFQQTVPINFLHFFEVVTKLKQKTKFITIECLKNHFDILEDKDLRQYLTILSQIGEIIYNEEYSDTIILQPDLLVKIITNIIRSIKTFNYSMSKKYFYDVFGEESLAKTIVKLLENNLVMKTQNEIYSFPFLCEREQEKDENENNKVFHQSDACSNLLESGKVEEKATKCISFRKKENIIKLLLAIFLITCISMGVSFITVFKQLKQDINTHKNKTLNAKAERLQNNTGYDHGIANVTSQTCHVELYAKFSTFFPRTELISAVYINNSNYLVILRKNQKNKGYLIDFISKRKTVFPSNFSSIEPYKFLYIKSQNTIYGLFKNRSNDLANLASFNLSGKLMKNLGNFSDWPTNVLACPTGIYCLIFNSKGIIDDKNRVILAHKKLTSALYNTNSDLFLVASSPRQFINGYFRNESSAWNNLYQITPHIAYYGNIFCQNSKSKFTIFIDVQKKCVIFINKFEKVLKNEIYIGDYCQGKNLYPISIFWPTCHSVFVVINNGNIVKINVENYNLC